MRAFNVSVAVAIALLQGGCKPPQRSDSDDADAKTERRETARRDDSKDRRERARDKRREKPRPKEDEPRTPDGLGDALKDAMKLLGSMAQGGDVGGLLGQDARKDDPVEPGKIIVHLRIDGTLEELEDPLDLFGMGPRSLQQVVDAINKAATDPNVVALLVEPDHVGGGAAKIEALRRAIAAFRAKGKRAFGYVTSPGAKEYLVALAAEEIAIAPTGAWLVTGVRAEALYLKDLLGSVGLAFDAVAVGEYKTAPEPLTRDRMSKEMREVLDTILDERMAALTAAAGLRKISAKELQDAIDAAPLTVAEAVTRRLVDLPMGRDAYVAWISKKLGLTEEPRLVADYGREKKKFDLASLFSFSNIFGRSKSDVASGRPKIAVVYAVGPIFGGKATRNPFAQDRAIYAEDFVATLKKIEKDATVRAVVLRVDSPGGSATASDQIWQAVEALKRRVPVVASFSDVAASGGYYIAAGANSIVAETGTLTGSIGVFGGKLVTEGLFKKFGVNREVVTRGKNSGLFSGAARFDANERAALEKMMKETYKEFLARVAQGRKLDVAKVDGIARGRVWTGGDAKGRGLVDQIGSLADAVDAAKTRAGFAAGADVEIVRYPKKKTFIDWIRDGGVRVDALPLLLSRAMKIDALDGPLRKWTALLSSPGPWTALPVEIRVE
ncbi:MAG: signal peptide peptidase SppA [Deltaproteobacteria bacterium]|nr:signal peptide peptidase SppA [Deltaproteobacteria bacterium]